MNCAYHNINRSIKLSSLRHLIVAQLLKDVFKRRLLDREAVNDALVLVREFEQVPEHLRPADALSVNKILENTLWGE